jgi:hypothetical protein
MGNKNILRSIERIFHIFLGFFLWRIYTTGMWNRTCILINTSPHITYYCMYKHISTRHLVGIRTNVSNVKSLSKFFYSFNIPCLVLKYFDHSQAVRHLEFKFPPLLWRQKRDKHHKTKSKLSSNCQGCNQTWLKYS